MKVWNYNLDAKQANTQIEFYREDTDALLSLYEAVAAQVTQAARAMEWGKVATLSKVAGDMARAIECLTAEPTLKEMIEGDADE